MPILSRFKVEDIFGDLGKQRYAVIDHSLAAQYFNSPEVERGIIYVF